MTRVLDHRNSSILAHCEDTLHVAGVARVVHDHDGAGAAGHAPRDLSRPDGPIIRSADIGEYRRGADEPDRVDSSGECQGRHNDLVSGPQSEQHVREVESRGC